MHIIEREIRKKYRYSNLSYVCDVYTECEYRANLTLEEYEGLSPGEFRFDYESWGRRLGFTKKQMERAIKELTTKSIVIIQVVKGNKGTCSKYFLARFEENNKEHNKEHNRRLINVENTSFSKDTGEQKEHKKENKKEHSSRYSNLDIISNIYSHWNLKKIIVHKNLTEDIKRAVEKALKRFSKEEIVQAIDIYAEALKSKFYFDYKWSLVDFLNRKNGISTFMDEGSNKESYKKWKDGDNNENTRRNITSYRGCFNEGAEEFEFKPDCSNIRHYTDEELEAAGII